MTSVDTDSPASPPGQAPAERSWAAPDDFTARLMKLAAEELRSGDLKTSLDRWENEQLEEDLLADVRRQADTLLDSTSRQIQAIVQHQQALDGFVASVAPFTLVDLVRRFATGIGCVGILGLPVAIWQAWPAVATALGAVWATLIALGAAVAVLGMVGAWMGIDEEAGAGSLVAMASVMGTFPVAYLIAVWQLWTPARQELGNWSLVIWIVLGFLAFSVAGGAFGVLDVPEAPEPQDAIVSVAAGAGAALGTWFALTAAPAVPGHWPEAGALLVAWVLGAGHPLLLRALLSPIRALLGAADDEIIPRSVVSRSLQTTQQRQRRLLAQAVRESDDEWRRTAREVLRQKLREGISIRVSPGFATEIDKISPFGLQMMRGTEYMVETRSFHRLGAEIAGLNGGAVGVAGPRGAGKSSLLEQYRDGRVPGANTAGDQLVVFESVPVTYEPREYVLYLYGAICDRVADLLRPRAETSSRRRASGHVAQRAGVALAVAAAWVVTVLVGAVSTAELRYEPPAWLSAGWIGLACAGVVVIAVALVAGPRPAADDPALDETPVQDRDDLRKRAERRLRTIRFQQKETFGSTGKFRLPFGGERSTTAAQEYQRHPMPYPEIANELRLFLTMTTEYFRKEDKMARIPLVIIFDELDKMSSPELVYEFLNTVKSLFSLEIPGCLFLVSVSEDALARFERRGLPVRDALDSTFDAIVPVEYLDLGDASKLLAGRAAGLPDPFIALPHVLSGGLARELLRFTRSLVRHRHERHLTAITRLLVGDELVLKARAFGAVIARRGLAEPYASDLMNFVNQHTAPDTDVLLKAIGQPPIEPADGDDAADALFLQIETLGFLYFCATVLETFSGLTREEYERRESSFDTLASARHLFTVNARLAWLTINSFREQWSLTRVEPPLTA